MQVTRKQLQAVLEIPEEMTATTNGEGWVTIQLDSDGYIIITLWGDANERGYPRETYERYISVEGEFFRWSDEENEMQEATYEPEVGSYKTKDKTVTFLY